MPTLSWNGITTYTNGTPIPPEKQAQIAYTTYVGPTESGPWSVGPIVMSGGSSVAVPPPAPGETLWYTIDCSLDGQTSEKGVPVSLTIPFLVPAAPTGLVIAL